MINNNAATNKYKYATELTSTRKTKQIVMLYDAIIKFLQKSMVAIENDNFEEKYNYTERASKIIEGLHNCLNPESGKEITELLDKFYSSIHLRILDLNFENESSINLENIGKIIKEVKIMRSAWDDVDQKAASGELDTTNMMQNATIKVEDSYNESNQKQNTKLSPINNIEITA